MKRGLDLLGEMNSMLHRKNTDFEANTPSKEQIGDGRNELRK